MKNKFDPDAIQQGIETLFGRAVEAITRGREEILKQSKIGKVKLFDLTQLRRERARLVARLGEEAYRGMQSGSLDKEDLDRTYKRIVSMDEQIAAKEAEVESLKREAEKGSAKSATGSTGSKKAAPPASSKSKKKPPMDTKKAASDDDDDDDEEEDEDDDE